jgi:hypothetical protein
MDNGYLWTNLKRWTVITVPQSLAAGRGDHECRNTGVTVWYLRWQGSRPTPPDEIIVRVGG